MTSTNIGNAIRNLRVTKGFSQEYMAALLHMSQNNYSKIETGKTNLTLAVLFNICQILKVSPLALLEIEIQNLEVEQIGHFDRIRALQSNEVIEYRFKELEKQHENLIREIKAIYESQINILVSLLKSSS